MDSVDSWYLRLYVKTYFDCPQYEHESAILPLTEIKRSKDCIWGMTNVLLVFLSLCRSWFGIWRLGSRWKWLTATQTWSSVCHLTQRGVCWPPAARTRSSASLSPALAKCYRCGLRVFSLSVYAAIKHSQSQVNRQTHGKFQSHSF